MKANGALPYAPRGGKKLVSHCSAVRKAAGWTQYAPRDGCTGVISGVKYESGRKDCGDSLVISEEGRQLAMAREMERDGISHETAMRLASGSLTVKEPDWESFEIPMLEVEPDPGVYRNAYVEESMKGFRELREQVISYYAPEFEKIRNMDALSVLDYLYRTYKYPFQADLYIPGTDIPAPPRGMSEDEADMRYSQLRQMYFRNGPEVRDPYALGPGGIKKLDSLEDRAREAGQRAYDAAKKELDAKKEVQKAQRREELKRIVEKINSGTGVCMGYLALRADGTQEA